MFGLLLRLIILGAVVFGVSRGIARALRTRTRQRAERDIRRELEIVRVGAAEGVLDRADQDQLTREIYARCRDAGIDLGESDSAGHEQDEVSHGR